MRAPLIVRWPGAVKAGVTNDHISAHWDLLPTLCELASIETPSGVDGISMVATLTGKADQTQHEHLYWEFYERGGKRAVRFGPWKAVQLNVNQNPNAPIELYHLPTDLGEQTNVAQEHPEQVRQALAFLKAHTLFTVLEVRAPQEEWLAKSP